MSAVKMRHDAATALGKTIRILSVSTADEIDAAFDAMQRSASAR